MKKLAYLLLIALSYITVCGQVTFKAQGPRVVAVNEPFQINFEVNAEGNNFKAGNMSDFVVQNGPYSSTSSSISIINNKMTQSIAINYTYVLSGKKAGKYTIGAASIQVDGKTYTSNTLQIEVTAGNANTQGAQGANGQEITDKDVFVRLELNKKNVYRGEAIIATVKLYTRVQLQQLSSFKMPQFDGFWKEDLPTNQNVTWQRENVNGEIYNCGILTESILMPQKAGTLSIKPIDLEVVAVQEIRRRRRNNPFNDPFIDEFFSDNSYRQVEKKCKSQPIQIQVMDIPSGAQAIGNFTLNSQISKKEVKANESLNLKITVSGKGNLKMLEPFQINFPPDFEVFDPETKQNINTTRLGVSGSKTFEYTLIPRHEGNYEIPAVTLACFDPNTGKTKELSTSAYQIKVLKGEAGNTVSSIDHSSNKIDVKLLGKDIRYLKTSNFELHRQNSTWFGSISFYLSYVVSIVAFIALTYVCRKRRLESADVIGSRKKKAGIMARKKLKNAELYLASQQKGSFYQELLQGTWIYLEDKLGIQKTDLTKDKIKQILNDKRIEQSTIDSLMLLIERCEMAQYAPSLANSNSMASDFQLGVDVISNLEESIIS